jgi:plasmid stability protein
MSKTHLTERINLWLDKELFHALEVLAAESERTIAAEMRLALRAHVAAAEKAAA